MKLGVTSSPAMVARLLEEGRSRDVRMQAQKPLLDTKISLAGPRGRTVDGTGHESL
jgi:hypothetical protein